MKKSTGIIILGLLLAGCASSNNSEELQRCEYNGEEFFCPQESTCGPSRCIYNPDEECGITLTKCEATESCQNGVCTCKATGIACSGTCCTDGCFATQTDPNHCGGCNIKCNPGEACVNGRCTANCPEYMDPCLVDDMPVCADLKRDVTHCGTCETRCPSGRLDIHVKASQCLEGRCIPICEQGWSDANNDISDGCETRSNSTCGNALIEPGETCDGLHLNDQTCETLIGIGSEGKLHCNSNCTGFITDDCSPSTLCGNQALNPGEVCDGDNVGSATCEQLVGAGSTGKLRCATNCASIDSTGCSKPNTCGNQQVDGNEKCDGSVPNDVTCASLVGPGSEGTVGCAENCANFDISKCTRASVCGNSIIENGEECDQTSFGEKTCESEVGKGSIGSLLCTPQCTIDKSACSAPSTCGDKTINGHDVCDGTQLNGKKCEDIVGIGSKGTLKCAANCANFDISGCSAPASCGNNQIENGEVCDSQRLNDQRCDTFIGKGSTGTLKCNKTCSGYDSTGCKGNANCGNNKIDSGEVCDNTKFNGKTCESEVGKGSRGSLRCINDCKTIDYSSCSAASLCNNGKVDTHAGEVCDGTDLNAETCESIVGKGSKGTLKCGSDCLFFDISGCSPSEYCGDGKIQSNEKCDLNNVAGRTCEDLVGTGSYGTLLCKKDCMDYDTSNCTPEDTCGDNAIEDDEKCDGDMLNGWTCEKQVGPGSTGTPKCNATCSGFENGTCTPASTCGNGNLDTGEDCDKTKFKDGVTSCKTYNSKLYTSGTLKCTPQCTIDISGCKGTTAAVCGNGTIEAGEVCDKTQFNGATCQSMLGKPNATGTLKCSSDCKTILTTDCNYCGDGKLNGDASEDCDGTDWMVSSCTEYSPLYSGGTLKCDNTTCLFNDSGCILRSVEYQCENDSDLRCTNGSPAKLQMCVDKMWQDIEECKSPLPICDISRDECMPVKWCSIKSVRKESGKWVGYSRIQLESGVEPSSAFLFCTQDLNQPVEDWDATLVNGKSDIVSADRNKSCSDCGYNTEYVTDMEFTMPSGKSYCTFVYSFETSKGSKDYACPYNGGLPFPTRNLKMTKSNTFNVSN
ncbi:MAG: hypothetical protein IJM59_11755 [Proteobacteria bacterium]|nr:hypothetical protein [Pseudomonadota bacterium]